MDGAAYVSQCPIIPHSYFTYTWNAENPGTYWYHSHFSNQRMDGIFGAIIIEQREIEQIKSIPMIVTDWFQERLKSLR